MKNKIKLWILLIEGWEKSPFYHESGSVFRTKKLPVKRYGFQSIENAFSNQFGQIKDVLQTNIFWLVFPMILGAIFFFFDDNSTVINNGIWWFSYAGAICFVWPLCYTVAAIFSWMYKGIKNLFKKEDK